MLVDPAAMRLDDAVGTVEILSEQAMYILGVDRVAERCEADETGEQDGHLAALAAGITINGLAIARHGSGRPYMGMPLEDHFRNDIIGGPGAFVVTAGQELSFSDAVLKKLVLEIAGEVPAEGQIGALAAE